MDIKCTLQGVKYRLGFFATPYQQTLMFILYLEEQMAVVDMGKFEIKAINEITGQWLTETQTLMTPPIDASLLGENEDPYKDIMYFSKFATLYEQEYKRNLIDVIIENLQKVAIEVESMVKDSLDKKE